MLRVSPTAAASLALLVLCTLAVLCTAQQPVESQPSGLLHGYTVNDFAASRNPSTPYLHYILDGIHAVTAIDARDGRAVQNVSFVNATLYMAAIAVDSLNHVFVLADGMFRAGMEQLLVLDASLGSLANISVTSLQPPLSDPLEAQLAVDSANSVYLFSSAPGTPTYGYVWVLSPRQWVQQAAWLAPVPLSFSLAAAWMEYVLAIDNTGLLYFQQSSGNQTLYLTDQQGRLQYSYQLGTGDVGEPWIRDVAVDAQLRMWHTHLNSSYVSVTDSNGQLVAIYNLVATSRGRSRANVDVDVLNRVVVADMLEQVLLVVSPQGDIVNTVSSPVASLMFVNELLADYSGHAGGSLLFGDWGSPYVVQRLSVDDSDLGTLLQRYTLPARLRECRDMGLDVGRQSNNIYVLIACGDVYTYPPVLGQYRSFVYVMTQAGRVVSEFRVHDDALRVRVDERAGVLYIASGYTFPLTEQYVAAYSTVDGRQLANYTTSSPSLGRIADLTLVPSSSSQGGSTVIVTDVSNARFVYINTDPSSATVITSQPFPPNTLCYFLTFSTQQNSSLFYVSCQYRNLVNGTFVYGMSFINRWDVTDPSQPLLTDIFLAPTGVLANFGAMAVGLDQHLYAHDRISFSVWQWRDADRASPASHYQQRQHDEPRMHVGQTYMGAPDTEQPDNVRQAGMAELAAHHRHERMRGAPLF